MNSDYIQDRIRSLEALIERDASYTRPEIRVVGEQTLALYFIALKLEELRSHTEDLVEIGRRILMKPA